MGWRAEQKSLLPPVAGEFFLLTLPFIERGNLPSSYWNEPFRFEDLLKVVSHGPAACTCGQLILEQFAFRHPILCRAPLIKWI